jgi:hypothetical protein
MLKTGGVDVIKHKASYQANNINNCIYSAIKRESLARVNNFQLL